MGHDRLSPRARWLASGDLRDPQNAVDGNVATAAVSRAAHQNATLTIDLGKICLFNMVVVEHGVSEFGFPRRMAVFTSTDGMKFRKQIEVPGLRKVTTAILIRQVLARYIRLQAAEPGDRPWSIAEVHLN